MTREEAKERLPIIQAFAEGKSIQDKIEGITDWIDTDEINFEYDGQKIIHRIKPEPKYLPFKTQEGCWNEMLKHEPFGWIKSEHGSYFNIYALSQAAATKEGIDIILGFDNPCRHKSNFLFDHFTFADGAPFGIKQ